MKRIYVFGITMGFILGGMLLAQRVGRAGSEPASAVTFTKDVAPIIFQNCAVCHRPGQVAPMSFLSFKEVRPWAKSIRETVATRQMPPWYADPNHGELINDRRLTQKQIATILA